MIAGTFRWLARAAAGPMQTFSSAKRTCSTSVSALECTATERMPASRQARMTRRAISPRLSIKTFFNTRQLRLHEPEELLAVFDVLAVLDQPLGDLAVRLGLDLV